MIFKDTDLPPMFDPNTPKYDQPIPGEPVTRKLNKGELKEKLE